MLYQVESMFDDMEKKMRRLKNRSMKKHGKLYGGK